MTFNLADLSELLQTKMVIYAIIAGVLICVPAAMLGVVLTLKRYSLIGHGLADVGFAAIAFALVFGINPVYISMPVVIFASFIIMAVCQKKGVAGDVAIGTFATASLALGSMMIFIKRGLNTNIYNYMFGSITSVSTVDIILSAFLFFIVISMFVLLYNRIFTVTYDENFVKTCGINITFYQFLISFLTAVTVVVGMKMIGSLLISSLIIFPSITAKRFSKSFKSLIINSVAISLVCFITGFFITLITELPTGATIVLVNVLFMALSQLKRK